MCVPLYIFSTIFANLLKLKARRGLRAPDAGL
jgi:hypothetical protein